MKSGRFTDDEVREIRQSRRPVRALAEEYGVSFAAIQKIRSRRSYRHVPDDPGQGPRTPTAQSDPGLREDTLPHLTPAGRARETKWLTDAEVREIRRSDRSSRTLAEKYGVSQPTIIRVKNGKSYGQVPDLDDSPLWGQYVRKYALDLMSGLPSGYCPTVVTSPPLFSMSNYSRQYMSRDEARFHYIRRQLRVIEECIRVAGDEGIVLYHTTLDIKSELLYEYERLGGFPSPEIIIWDHLTPEPSPGNWYNTKSYIVMFTGQDWRIPVDWSAKPHFSGDTWEIELMDEQEYMKLAPPSHWKYSRDWDYGGSRYSYSTYRRYMQQRWYSFPDELADRCLSFGRGTVLDPFAGAGAIPLAAKRAGRPWLASDTRISLMKIFERRVSEEYPHQN